VRVPPARRVAERVPRCLAIGMPGLLQLLAGGAVFVPVRWKLAVETDFGKPGFAVGDEPAADAPGHADPFAPDRRDLPRDVVIAALVLADLLGDVGRIGKAVGIKLR